MRGDGRDRRHGGFTLWRSSASAAAVLHAGVSLAGRGAAVPICGEGVQLERIPGGGQDQRAFGVAQSRRCGLAQDRRPVLRRLQQFHPGGCPHALPAFATSMCFVSAFSDVVWMVTCRPGSR